MPVYFIQAGEGGPVKIGWAVDPVSRLRELQCGNHAELRLLRELPGSITEERVLHRAFSHLRIRGEWFSFDPKMLAVEMHALLADRTETPLQRAVHVAGGQTALANLIGRKQAHVWNWLNVTDRIPAEAAVDIEVATGVPRWKLRPDLWPAPAVAPSEAAE
jgi:DNA-binding transcriptional regulator YdaS (Cro superfamily)